jgi:hypothetical protein
MLHRTAAELSPERLPYYVAAPTRPGVGVGWYWIPAGTTDPQLLGSNVVMAEIFLLQRVDAAALAARLIAAKVRA